jgi:3-oxoacyl-[acyl-carrier-protein] synthase-1
VSNRTRVVITGMGAICAAGEHPDAIFDALVDGHSAIASIRQWSTEGLDVPPAGEVPRFEPASLVADRKAHKLLRRADFFGLYAANVALGDAGPLEHRARLSPGEAAGFDERSGIFVGSGGVGHQHQHDFLPLLALAGGDLGRFGEELRAAVNPLWLLQSLPNSVLCHLGIQTGFKGANTCIATHGASGALALVEAAAAIRCDEVDRAVVVGHDSPLEPQGIRELDALGLLARDAIRPFDAWRSGTLLGEGAAALVLESDHRARERGATVLAELLGAGCASEAQGLLPVRDDGDGPARAIASALADAQLAPDEIGMIVAHGNGTRRGDLSEARAIERVFGEAPPPVSAFKWAFGHTLAAAGTLDAVLAILALRGGCVPGVATLRERDADCARLPVSSVASVPRCQRALVLARGFAGVNLALVLQASRAGG